MVLRLHGSRPHSQSTLTVISTDGEKVANLNKNREEIFLGEHKYEILGRPIRLADVLLAIDNVKPSLTDAFSDTFCGVRINGEFEMMSVGDSFSSGVKWNLREDNLDSQSEETITFLAELLKT